jgi:hypothetical protein
MFAQKLNNIDGIIAGLDALSKHPLDDHSSCEDWCDHIKDPSKKYKSLPPKLSEMGCTQANKSLNMTIASKAPKRYHFSGSASLSYRAESGVVSPRFLAICEKVCGEPTHFLANCEKVCNCEKVWANTWDDFSQLRKCVGAPTLSRKLRESVKSPPYFFEKHSICP